MRRYDNTQQEKSELVYLYIAFELEIMDLAGNKFFF